MDLRYRLAVVTGAGGGLGREVAVALGRLGAAVLAVDRDLPEVERTADLVRSSRVGAWALQADPTEAAELPMIADRARDLGGMDLLVTCPDRTRCEPASTLSQLLEGQLEAPVRLTRLFLDGLAERRGRRDGTPAVVVVAPGAGGDPGLAAVVAGLTRFTGCLADPAVADVARVMAVVPTRSWGPEVVRAVTRLLSEGLAGEVVGVGAQPEPAPDGDGPPGR